MPREQTVPAEAKVMRWARETRGYSLRRAAQELGIPQSRLEAIENDRQPVSATVFRKMISVYQQVESVLLLPEIPETDPLPEDYRTVGGVPRVPRPETLLAFREVRRIQRYVSELLTDDPELMLHADITAASLSDSAEELGERERRRSGVTHQMVTRWHPYRDAFNRWRARVQEMGILVLVEEMIWGDCRGLSLWDAGSPAMIVLSSQDAFNGRIFTMFHEYGHLMLRQPGSCLIAVQDQTSKGRVERWCNTFAASFLLPASEFKDQIANLFPKVSRDAWTLWHIERLAAKFRVSPYATARRLKELGITDFYDTRHEELRLFDKRRPPPRREEQTGGLRAEVKKLGEIGVGAAGVFLEALRGQVIDAPEAADALGLRLDQLKGLEEETEAQRSRIHV